MFLIKKVNESNLEEESRYYNSLIYTNERDNTPQIGFEPTTKRLTEQSELSP